MTYYTLKCGNCGATVSSGMGELKGLGKPYIRCPYCFDIVSLAPGIEEWAMKTPEERKSYMRSTPLSIAIFTGFIFGSMTAIGNLLAGLIAGVVIFLLTLLIAYPVCKLARSNKILESIIRTKNENYANHLEKLGFKLYDISDAEIADLTGYSKKDFMELFEKRQKELNWETDNSERLIRKTATTMHTVYNLDGGKNMINNIYDIVFMFNSNMEFLNEIFNMNIKFPLYTSRYKIDEDTEIWIVKFDNVERENYRNYFTNDENIAHEKLSCQEKREKRKKRIVVAKHDFSKNTMYEIKGIYERNEEMSSEFENVYVKTEEDISKYINKESDHIKGFIKNIGNKQ